MLVDHNPGDGGFCVVPGSHKSNFKMPEGMVDGITHSEYIQQPATKAGDVVLFSEVPWDCNQMFNDVVHCTGLHPQLVDMVDPTFQPMGWEVPWHRLVRGHRNSMMI